MFALRVSLKEAAAGLVDQFGIVLRSSMRYKTVLPDGNGAIRTTGVTRIFHGQSPGSGIPIGAVIGRQEVMDAALGTIEAYLSNPLLRSRTGLIKYMETPTLMEKSGKR